MQPLECIIFDTEFTAWEGSQQRHWSLPWEHRELIQLAAVKVQISGHEVRVISTFNELIKPVINPQLSTYIVSLTGIEQALVDSMGVDFASALNQFVQFSNNGNLPVFSWGNDIQVLRENCQLYQLSQSQLNIQFVNLQQLAQRQQLSGCDLSSGELADFHGLSLTGQRHNALFDVRSLAMTLQVWIAEGAITPADLGLVEG